MPNLRNLVLHVGQVGAPVGDPERLFDKYPSVQRASFCVTDHLMWHLGSKVDLCRASKLILRTDPNVKSLKASVVEDMISVKLLRIPFDLEAANELEGIELKKMLLASTTQAVVWLAEKEGLDGQPIRDAADQVRFENYQFGFYFKRGRSWKSSSKMKARIYLRYDWDRYDVIAEILEGRKVIGHKLLHSTVPVEWPLPSLVRQLNWTPGGKLSLKTSDLSTFENMTVTSSVKSLNDGAATEYIRID
ncbi:MAG TPA: hypothetical protein DHW22_02540 [Planctomycetaceae bacterium]|nr:hypothetical protein [Planctomycetaceae bacterium]